MSAGFIEDVDGRLVPRDTVPARDAYVVSSEPISEAVQTFVTDWKRNRPPSGGQFGGPDQARTEVTTARALDWLATASGLSEADIQGFVRGRRGTTDFQTADALLSAIGRPDLLATIRVERKPD